MVKQDIGLSEKKDVGKQAEVTGAGQPVIMTAEEASTPVTSVKADTQHQPPPTKCIAQLIGKRCMVSCAINGVPLQMLLDSGAQVTVVGSAWTLPNIQIQPLQSLLFDQPLEILSANGTDVPFDGWADVELQVCSQNDGHVTI